MGGGAIAPVSRVLLRYQPPPLMGWAVGRGTHTCQAAGGDEHSVKLALAFIYSYTNE